MIKKTNVISISIASVALLIAIFQYFNQKEIAFFDYNIVYNNCKLKIKLEKDLMRVGSKRKSELDSLQMELSFLSQRIGNNKTTQGELDKFEEMKTRFLAYKDKYEQENMQLKDNYTTQIRKDINDNARLYAEKNGYHFLFAATGDGSLMYAKESEDVTKDFQKFLDKK
jgi:Skp family chaperone for outer membrane proteins